MLSSYKGADADVARARVMSAPTLKRKSNEMAGMACLRGKFDDTT
jgi:hypothetical protein